MVKRVWLCLMLILFLAIPVGAQEAGSIRLVMRYQGSTVAGGSVKLYDVTDFPADADPEILAKLLSSMGSEGIVQKVGDNGTVYFGGLEMGCYLMVQEQVPPGYHEMKPFLISVPITVNDRIQWEIDAFPKLEKIPEGELPQTGQPNLPVWVLMGSGSLLLCFGILTRKRK